MTLKRLKKNPLLWLYVGGAVLLVVAVWLWCFKISVDPERTFWATIEHGLANRGVTIQSEQESGGARAKQTIQFSLGAENLSHARTSVNTQPGTTVVSETIGTPTVDYTRYLDIQTDQKKRDGGKMDFSKVLNIWSKGAEGSAQLFTQAVFGSTLPVGGMGVPLGNLSAEARDRLMRQIRDDVVYQIDFSKVKKERLNGRLVYTYDASLQPVAYVAMVKSFAQSIGLHGLDEINPADYKGQQPFKLKITVDVRARQVVTIAANEGPAKQTYSGYDVPVQTDLPKETISSAELQKRLADLQ
jgi:hypothetical protein